MRTATLITAVLAPTALASAISAPDSTRPFYPFDQKRDIAVEKPGGVVLQSDVYATNASRTQQVYQAKQKPDQWKKCNPSNIVVRREWYDDTISTCNSKSNGTGQLFRQPRRKTTSLLLNV
jgi:tyrosinase